MFEDVIEILLKKKAALREEIEREFAARENKIDELLALAGYVEPQEPAEEPVEMVEADNAPAPAGEADNGVNVY